MANNLSITKSYDDGTVYTEAQLDAFKSSIEGFLNNTRLTADNLQSGSLSSTEIVSSAITTAKIASTAVSEIKLASDTSEGLAAPGMIVAYAGVSAPTGWLMCDGSTASRSTYASLFAAVSTSHGAGDGSTTFHLPKLNGYFIRGATSSTARDPDYASRTAMAASGATGGAAGSIQTAALVSHTHTLVYTGTALAQGAQSFKGTGSNQPINSITATSASGGNETRPINAYVNYIIKT